MQIKITDLPQCPAWEERERKAGIDWVGSRQDWGANKGSNFPRNTRSIKEQRNSKSTMENPRSNAKRTS